MKYNVDGWNNFCRVFKLPDEYPNGYCFGGGHPTNFIMVDWFNPIPGIPQSGITKKSWKERIGEIEVKEIDGNEIYSELIEFLLNKNYVKENHKYLVICDFGYCFIFNKQ